MGYCHKLQFFFRGVNHSPCTLQVNNEILSIGSHSDKQTAFVEHNNTIVLRGGNNNLRFDNPPEPMQVVRQCLR
jgi:hypothetical protein